jgi:hypothetical protein
MEKTKQFQCEFRSERGFGTAGLDVLIYGEVNFFFVLRPFGLVLIKKNISTFFI